METAVILTDADGNKSQREMTLRQILNFVSGIIKQGRSLEIVTDGGKLKIEGDDETA